jgi:hypothetical protein
MVGGRGPEGHSQNLAYLDASDRFVDPGCVIILIEDAFNEVSLFFITYFLDCCFSGLY